MIVNKARFWYGWNLSIIGLYFGFVDEAIDLELVFCIVPTSDDFKYDFKMLTINTDFIILLIH